MIYRARLASWINGDASHGRSSHGVVLRYAILSLMYVNHPPRFEERKNFGGLVSTDLST